MLTLQARPQVDRVATLLDKQAHAYQVCNFDNFVNAGIRPTFHKAEEAVKILDGEGKWLGWDRYVVDIWSEEPKEIRVRVSSKGKVQVRLLGHWMALRKYLRQLKAVQDTAYTYGTPETRASLQAQWWTQNGKVFPLMALPRELRDMIYAQAFGPVIEPCPVHSARRGAVVKKSDGAALITVCKQVNEECRSLLGRQTPFLVQHHGICVSLLSTPLQRQSVQRLELALDHRAFFDIFAIFPEATIAPNPSFAGGLLRNMNLKRLTLRFAEPSCTTGHHFVDAACQKKIVDWILWLAGHHVHGHQVEITGFVKARQKAAFEAQFRNAKKHFDWWNRERVFGGETMGSLAEYDEWMEQIEREEEETGQEDGGVSVVEYVPTTAVARHPARCRCTELCMLRGRWTDAD